MSFDIIYFYNKKWTQKWGKREKIPKKDFLGMVFTSYLIVKFQILRFSQDEGYGIWRKTQENRGCISVPIRQKENKKIVKSKSKKRRNKKLKLIIKYMREEVFIKGFQP